MICRCRFVILVLLLVYWMTRLWNLLILPAFMDEGIYIWRSQVILHDGNLAFEITDGNILQPRLLAFVLAPTINSVPALLFASRWLTVALDVLDVLFLFS